jgi:hypothetical protein
VTPEDVFAFDGRFYTYLERIFRSGDVRFLRSAFEKLAGLERNRDAPRPWPFSAGYLPFVEQARRVTIAVFWLAEWSQREPATRNRGVGPLEWIGEIYAAEADYQKMVAAASPKVIAKNRREHQRRRSGGLARWGGPAGVARRDERDAWIRAKNVELRAGQRRNVDQEIVDEWNRLHLKDGEDLLSESTVHKVLHPPRRK